MATIDPVEQEYLDLVEEINTAIEDCHDTQDYIDSLHDQLDELEGGDGK